MTEEKRAIVINTRQRGNPVLKHLTSTSACPVEYSTDIDADFLLGSGRACLYLSIRYHRLHPDYIYDRFKSLSTSSSNNNSSGYSWKVLILHVDITDGDIQIREMTKLCILQNVTLFLAWTGEEVSHILQTIKSYQSKPIDSLKERTSSNQLEQVIDLLTSIRGVNKTDALTLLTRFGSLQGIVTASEDELKSCPGIGPQKVHNIISTFHQPFITQ